MTTDQVSEHAQHEREQIIQDYLDGHMSRGGLINDEVRAQAAAYADRIAGNRAYEAELRAQAEKQRAQIALATTDAALRARGNRRALMSDYLNRFAADAPITDELRQAAARYADRVLVGRDPAIEQRQVAAAAERLAHNKAQAERDVAMLRALLIEHAGSDDRAALRAMAKRFRSALDEIDARLFREAMRPPSTPPQGAPEESGEGSAAPARGRQSQRTNTTKRHA
jgi:hypothetical protein